MIFRKNQQKKPTPTTQWVDLLFKNIYYSNNKQTSKNKLLFFNHFIKKPKKTQKTTKQ